VNSVYRCYLMWHYSKGYQWGLQGFPTRWPLVVPGKCSGTTCDVPNRNIQSVNHKYYSDILQKEQ
jgi:hypothetical protein